MDFESLNSTFNRASFAGSIFVFYGTFVVLHALLGFLPRVYPKKTTKEFRCQWKRNILCMCHALISFFLSVGFLAEFPQLISHPTSHFENQPLLLISFNIGYLAFDMVGCLLYFGSNYTIGSLFRSAVLLVFFLHVYSTKRFLGFAVHLSFLEISTFFYCIKNALGLTRNGSTCTYKMISLFNLILVIVWRTSLIVYLLNIVYQEKMHFEQDWMIILASLVLVINAFQTTFLIIVTVSELVTGNPMQIVTEETRQLMLPIRAIK